MHRAHVDARRLTPARAVTALPARAASGVAWKAGKDVTVKVMKKKPKPGGWW